MASISNALDSAGLATGLAEGTTTITATFVERTGERLTDSAAVTGTRDLAAIEVTPAAATIVVGTTQQFKATGLFAVGPSQDLTTAVTWTSSTPEVASISNALDSAGLATGLAEGTTTITATFVERAGEQLTDSAAVTGTRDLAAIEVMPAAATIVVGTTQQFKATGIFAVGPSQDLTSAVTWTSSTPEVASISNALDSAGLATGLAEGTTTITATFVERTGEQLTDSEAVTILRRPVTPPRSTVTPPKLITPTDNAAIAQNSPSIGCPSHPTRGFGLRIFFDWTDATSPNGIAGYQIFATQRDASLPIVDTFVTASELTYTNCNAFVADQNLNGWEWSVQAQDNLGNFSPPSDTGLFRFAPCRLQNGSPCFAQAQEFTINFETPSLGTSPRQVVNPYVDPATGVTFTAEPGGVGDAVVGLVKNNATSACVEPVDQNQKLGTGRQSFSDGSIGLSGFAIRATFPTLLLAPVTVSVSFKPELGYRSDYGFSVLLGPK